MHQHALRDTLHTALGIGLGLIGISIVNSRFGDGFTPSLVLGYAVAIAGLLVAGRAVMRSLYGHRLTVRELRKPALFVAAAAAGEFLVSFLPDAYQPIAASGLFIALSVVGGILVLRSVRSMPLPRAQDALDGVRPTDAPRRWPPP